MSALLVADERVLRGVAATIHGEIVDQEGTLTAPVGPVTVDIARADGTALTTGRATTAGTEAGRYTAALSPAELAALDVFTCTWKDGATARATTTVEVVGGYYFSVADVRAFDSSLASDGKYTDEQILAARRETEDEVERICRVAFVPRFRRATIDATCVTAVVLPDPLPRTIRSITCQDPSATPLAFTSTELGNLQVEDTGLICRTDGGRFSGRVVVTYEHGHDAPPSDLRHAALTRLRTRLNMERSGVPPGATSYVPVGGGATFSVAQPGRAGYETGIPEVDAVLKRYSWKTPGIG